MFAVIGVVSFIANFTQFYGTEKAGARMTRRLRSRLFATLLRQEISWFDKEENAAGALTTRLSSDTAMVQAMAGERLGLIAVSVSTIVTGLVIAFVADWILTLIILVRAHARARARVPVCARAGVRA